MDNLHLHILSLRDEVVENWNMVRDCIMDVFPKKRNSVGVATGDLGMDSDGRVWVEVGRPGLRLKVMHLHPANPTVAEGINARLSGSEDKSGENMISLPSEDEISLASLEDYWFNHWQGPFITADTNQNNLSIRLSRRSLRKSKRKSRCSVCRKKIVGAERLHEEHQEAPCFDGENVLAHVPSVKLETRSPNPKPEDSAAVSSDDECMKPAISEEALSRYSASDEQLARAYRVMDKELRTSFTLFSEDTLTQDVVDGVSMRINDSVDSPDSALRLAPPVPHSPRQSRSCPCSPKLSGRNHSPKSNTNSPKPRSRSERSKFSLSSSLMAIHRQASNSLRPDFLRFDSGKGDGGGSSSKNGSQQNSLKNEVKHCRSLAEPSNLGESYLNSSHSGSLGGGQESSRNALHESHSLPALKLSKMVITYKGGVIINEDTEYSENGRSDDKSKLLSDSACALPSTPENDAVLSVSDASVFLPDVVPKSENEPSSSFTSSISNDHSSSFSFEPKNGVINLGFDGHEESSDFTDLNDAIAAKVSEMEGNSSVHTSRRGSIDSDIDIGKNNIQLNISSVHAISVGHSSPRGQDLSVSLDMPQAATEESFQQTTDTEINRNLEFSDTASTSSTVDMSSTGNTTSPGIRVAEYSSTTDHVPEIDDTEDEAILYDHMHEARQLVFWWQKSKSNEDSEFCQNHTECHVKEKPLLLFIHGMGGSSDIWKQQLWYFVCCGYEVVAPDLLGHGLSSAPKEECHYTFSQMLDHITLVFDLFVPQGRKCVIIGHGYGASLAAALARGRQLSVRLLILASSGGPSPLIPNPPSKTFMHSYLGTFLNPFFTFGCCSRELLYAPRGKHFAVSSLIGSSQTPTPRYVLEYMARGQNWPEGDVAFHRRITVPTLLLQGMKDDRVGLVEMCEMERTIPRAFLELVPGGGHDLMVDAPLDVCHAIHRFIKRWQRQSIN